MNKEGIQAVLATDVGLTTGGLFVVLFILIGVNVAIFLVYKNFVKKEIDDEMKIQVSSAVSQYVALS